MIDFKDRFLIFSQISYGVICGFLFVPISIEHTQFEHYLWSGSLI